MTTSMYWEADTEVGPEPVCIYRWEELGDEVRVSVVFIEGDFEDVDEESRNFIHGYTVPLRDLPRFWIIAG